MVREVVKTLAAKGLVSVRPRHGTHVLPRNQWSLLDRDVLSWLMGQDEPDRDLLLAIQEVRSIIEPAAAALAAQRATKTDRGRINAALAAMEASKDHASATAADKAFHLAILDATHNPVLQGFRGAIDTILSTVFVVAIGDAARAEGTSLVRALRESGVAADAAYEDRPLKAQLRMADRTGAKFAAIIGEREIADAKVTFRRLEDGEQTQVPIKEAGEWISRQA